MKKALFYIFVLSSLSINAQFKRVIDLGVRILSPAPNTQAVSPGKIKVIYSLKNHGPDTIQTNDSFFVQSNKDKENRLTVFQPNANISPGDSIIIDNYYLPLYNWEDNNNFSFYINAKVIGGFRDDIIYETIDNIGVSNTSVIKLKLVKNTSVNDLELFNQINLYPNPTSGIFSIENKSDATIERVEVFNAMGQLLQSSNVSSFDMSGFANGHYLVKIHTKQSVVFKRIVLNQ